MTRSPLQLGLRENHLFFAVTVVVGVICGLAAVLFALSIDLARHLLIGFEPSAIRALVVPTAVGIVTGLLLAYVFHDVRGSGVPQTKAAYHLHDGRIGPMVPIGKFITGVLAIGSGHSMGREGPSVQIGAGLASSAGQWLGLPSERVRMLVPVGASAALAAAFNTPIAAVLFSLEEIIADMNAPLLGSTVVASVAAVIVERSILGNEPLFHVPAYRLVHPGELLVYAALGIVGGIVSVAFCKMLLGMRSAARRLPGWTRVAHPALGGLAIGVLLLVLPQSVGVGYEYVDQALNGGLAAPTMLVFLVAKLAATSMSYASGNAGGIFGPTLFFGAMTGGVVGTLAERISPFPAGEPGAYALVGMGALFAGVIRAPMTSVFMMFEITQDYQIIVPLMVANLLSLFISRRYQPEPVYHALLRQDGTHLPRSTIPASVWRAGDLMSSDMRFVPPRATIAAAVNAAGDRPCIVIGTPAAAVGIVSRNRLLAAVEAGRGGEPVDAAVDGESTHVHPDHPLEIVLDRLAASGGVLPVVDRVDVRRVVGIITREAAMEALFRD